MTIFVRPELGANSGCAIVETSVCSVVAGYRFPQVVSSISLDRLAGLLGLVARVSQVPISELRCDLIANDGRNGRIPNVNFTAIISRGKENGVGANLGLIDWRNGLRLSRQPA